MFDRVAAAVGSARTPAERVRGFARAENAACAARLSAMADMLAAAHAADGSAEREQWRMDNWGAVSAAIGAANTVTSGAASGLLLDAVTLRERLPRVAAVFAEGIISYRLVHAICLRTALVQDTEALAALDADLARELSGRGAMSMDQAQRAIDALVLRHDPFAVRRTETAARGHHVDVLVEDGSGTATLSGRLSATDGKAIDERADALARTVCDRDPRTLDQRRSAAFGAMGMGWDRVPCLCGRSDCAAALKPAVGGAVIHVIAREDTIADPGTETDPDGDPGPDPDGAPGPDLKPEPSTAREPDAEQPDAEQPDAEQPEPVPEPEVESEEHRPAAEPAAPPVGDAVAQRRALVGDEPPLLPRPWQSYSLAGLTAALTADRGEYGAASPQ